MINICKTYKKPVLVTRVCINTQLIEHRQINVPVIPEMGWTRKGRKTRKAIAKLFILHGKAKRTISFGKYALENYIFLRAAFIEAFVYGSTMSN